MELENQHVLIVEDNVLIATDLAATVQEAGAKAVVPAASVGAALDLLNCQRITVAVLDVNLRKELSLAVAQRLSRDQIPFVYHTSQDALVGGSGWPKAPIIGKPSPRSTIVGMIADAASQQPV